MAIDIIARGMKNNGGGGGSVTPQEFSDLKKQTEVLWKLTHGIVWETQTDNTEAYTKTVPSGAVAAEIGSIGGKTVVWNQQINPDDYVGKTSAGIRFEKGSGTTVTITGAASATVFLDLQSGSNFVSGHKYYVGGISGGNAARPHLRLRASGDVAYYIYNPGIVEAGNYQQSSYLRLQIPAGYDAGTGETYTFLCIDLTLMFGAGNEPTDTEDSRIAAIEAYYALHPGYDTGTLLHGAVTEIAGRDAAGNLTESIVIPAVIRALEGYGQSEVGGDGNTLNLSAGTYTEIGHYVDGTWTPLDTPVTVDVGGMLPGNMLEVETGGTVLFEQDGTELAVPSIVDYLIKLSEVEP